MSYYLVVGGEKWMQIASISGWKEFRKALSGIPKFDEIDALLEYGWSQDLDALQGDANSLKSLMTVSKDVRSIAQAIYEAVKNRPEDSESALLTDGLTSADDPDESGWDSGED